MGNGTNHREKKKTNHRKKKDKNENKQKKRQVPRVRICILTGTAFAVQCSTH